MCVSKIIKYKILVFFNYMFLLKAIAPYYGQSA